MMKTLKVIEPFMGLEKDDEFVWDGKFYVAQQSDEYMKHSDDGDTFQASFQANCTLSKEYAESLVEQGYLSENDPENTGKFVNVFDEIDSFIEKYTKNLNDLNKKDVHPAVKHEEETVYYNMLKVLNYLKGLRK